MFLLKDAIYQYGQRCRKLDGMRRDIAREIDKVVEAEFLPSAQDVLAEIYNCRIRSWRTVFLGSTVSIEIIEVTRVDPGKEVHLAVPAGEAIRIQRLFNAFTAKYGIDEIYFVQNPIIRRSVTSSR